MVEIRTESSRHPIILQADRAFSGPDARRWRWLLAMPACVVALGWSLAGDWIVLPFAGRL